MQTNHPGLGIGQCQRRLCWRSAISVLRSVLLLGGGLIGFLYSGCPAAGQTARLEARDVEIRLYPKNSTRQIAVCRVDRVYTDYRKMGFFRIKLLPVLVVEGVRLEFNQTEPQSDWLEGLQFDPPPGMRGSAVEWHNFSVFVPGENQPRLHANRVLLTANAGATVYRLEGVTIQSGGESLAVPKAELQTKGQAGRVVWTRSGKVIQWNLFTGQFATNSISEKPNEKL